MSLAEKAVKFTMAPFDADRGPRSRAITASLAEKGIQPLFTDQAGNIWYAKGRGSIAVIISSHMDTQYGLNPEDQHFVLRDGVMQGTLDNSVGCAINAEVLENAMPKCRAYFIFSTGEEMGYQGARRAKQALESGKILGHEVKLFIALDVTYPANRFRRQSSVKPLAFAENFSGKTLESYVEAYLKAASADGVVAARSMATPDEACVFHLTLNSMAFGPVTSGLMHSKKCTTTLASLEASASMLKRMLEDEKFINEIPAFEPEQRGACVYPGAQPKTGHFADGKTADYTVSSGGSEKKLVMLHDLYAIFRVVEGRAVQYYARIRATGTKIPMIHVSDDGFVVSPFYLDQADDASRQRLIDRLGEKGYISMEDVIEEEQLAKSRTAQVISPSPFLTGLPGLFKQAFSSLLGGDDYAE